MANTIHMQTEEVSSTLARMRLGSMMLMEQSERLRSGAARLAFAWMGPDALRYLVDLRRLLQALDAQQDQLVVLYTRLGRELEEWLQADQVLKSAKKYKIYLINGINYNGSDRDMTDLERSLEEQYGSQVDVVVIAEHPYDTNLEKYGSKRTHFGGWLSPIDWFTGLQSNVDAAILGGINTLVGVTQVGREYVTGSSSESDKVYKFIEKDLAGKQDVNVILLGHSGGGAIAANLSGRIEHELDIEVSGVGFMGSPVANRDYALDYAETVLDINHQNDLPAQALGFGQLRSDESRYQMDEVLISVISDPKRALIDIWTYFLGDSFARDPGNSIQVVTNDASSGWFAGFDSHLTYWHSQTVIDSVGKLIR